MRKLFTAVMAATMLLPTTVMASSIRPGSRVTHKSLNTVHGLPVNRALCVDDEDKFTEKCDIIIDDTGVVGPDGHITHVVQWDTELDKFNVAGGVVGGAAGAAGGTVAGLSTCLFVGPLCMFTAPMIMSAGVGAGADAGGKSGATTFIVVGDDVDGTRIIQQFKYNKRLAKVASKNLLKYTQLAKGETRT
jgi:hypothetical protein